MLLAEDFRAIARDALRGRWLRAAGVGLLAGLLGAGIDGTSVNLNTDSLDGAAALFQSDFFYRYRIFFMIGGAMFLVYVLVCLVIGGAATLGYARYNLDLVDGKDPDVTELFSQFHRIWQGFCLQFLVRDLRVQLLHEFFHDEVCFGLFISGFPHFRFHFGQFLCFVQVDRAVDQRVILHVVLGLQQEVVIQVLNIFLRHINVIFPDVFRKCLFFCHETTSLSGAGVSARPASVVSRVEATDAALSSARRLTLTGSMMPLFTMSTYVSVSTS